MNRHCCDANTHALEHKTFNAHAQIKKLISIQDWTTPRKNVCACVGHKKDGKEFKRQIVNKNMAI
jgi:hypothetical protein